MLIKAKADTIRAINAVHDKVRNSLEIEGTNHFKKIIMRSTTPTKPKAELL